jgi:hypothetical protein
MEEQMKEASLSNASTIAIIVHGVGDHSGRRILWAAEKGFRSYSSAPATTEEVTFARVSELNTSAIPFGGSLDQPGVGLELQSEGRQHFVVPLVWSRLRPRAANEADFQSFKPVSQLLNKRIQSTIFLFPSALNALRCIPAAPGLARRVIVATVAFSYLVLVPCLLFGLIYFVSWLTMLRLSLDKQHHLWWRWPLLLLIFWLAYWLSGKLLMVCDFVGDIVAYVGNRKLRRKAEDRLLGVVRALASAAPHARLLLIGHSLGSVLVTHTTLQLEERGVLRGRVYLLTMGSPLRLMSWFFPQRVVTPERLLTQLNEQKIVSFWLNLWRDADVIGRSLNIKAAAEQQGPAQHFAEMSLGNGTHTDYWADSRSWWAVVEYIQAASDGSIATVPAVDAAMAKAPLTPTETADLIGTCNKRYGLALLVASMAYCFLWRFARVHHWSVWLLLGALCVELWIFAKYVFLTQTINVPGTSQRLGHLQISLSQTEVRGVFQRQLLVRNRLGLFLEKSIVITILAVSLAVGLTVLMWRAFTAY